MALAVSDHEDFLNEARRNTEALNVGNSVNIENQLAESVLAKPSRRRLLSGVNNIRRWRLFAVKGIVY